MDADDPTDGTETELKLVFDPGDLDALSTALTETAGPADEREQRSTYFDTGARDLERAGASLRVRRTGDAHVQTVKFGGGAAAGLFARPEWEQAVAGPAPVVGPGSPLHALVPAAVLDQVAPAFTVAVTRRRWTAERDGATIEVVADTGAVEAEDRRSPVCELELELKAGPPAALFALARDLAEVVPLRLGVLTKSERGYRLLEAATVDAVKARPLDLAGDAGTAEAFAAVVGACLRQFRLNEDLLGLEAPTASLRADALHQARVALRRLRSAVSIFGPVVADGPHDRRLAELRWLAGTLGDARDLDVLVARLGDAGAPRLAAARERAHAAAVEALRSRRARAVLIDLVEWTATGEWRARPAASQPAHRFAVQALKKLRRRLKRRGRNLTELTDERRHRARIAAKRLRYGVGFLETLFPGKREQRRRARFRKRLEALQDRLGELNDLATAPVLLDRYGLSDIAPGLASPRRRARLLRKAGEDFEDLMDARPFWR